MYHCLSCVSCVSSESSVKQCLAMLAFYVTVLPQFLMVFLFFEKLGEELLGTIPIIITALGSFSWKPIKAPMYWPCPIWLHSPLPTRLTSSSGCPLWLLTTTHQACWQVPQHPESPGCIAAGMRSANSAFCPLPLSLRFCAFKIRVIDHKAMREIDHNLWWMVNIKCRWTTQSTKRLKFLGLNQSVS